MSSWTCPKCSAELSSEFRFCPEDASPRDTRPEGYFICGRGHRRSNPILPCQECETPTVQPPEVRGRR